MNQDKLKSTQRSPRLKTTESNQIDKNKKNKVYTICKVNSSSVGEA